MQEDMTHDPLTPEQREAENALAAFRPAATQINRDAMMYAAGKAVGEQTVRRQLWPLRIACSLLVASTATLALWPANHPETAPVSITPIAVNLPAPIAPTAPPDTASDVAAFDTAPDSDSYLHLRQRVLLLGLSALPTSPPPASTHFSNHAPDAFDASPASQRKILSSSGDHS